MNKVRTQGGQIQLIRAVHLPVQQDHRDLGLLRLFQHRVPARGHDRRQQDRVNALRDERSDRGDLVFLFLLRIREAQIDAVLFGLLLASPGLSDAGAVRCFATLPPPT